MAGQKPMHSDLSKDVSFLGGIFNQARLVWLLFKDQRVPLWAKSVVPLSLLYLISPIDLIPGALVPILGQLDDLGVILLGMALFVKLCPPDLVEYYRNQLEYDSDPNDEAVDTTYQVIDED